MKATHHTALKLTYRHNQKLKIINIHNSNGLTVFFLNNINVIYVI